MKVRLDPIEIDDDLRRALAHHYGHPGLFSRAAVKWQVSALLRSWLDMVWTEYAEAKAAERKRPEASRDS